MSTRYLQLARASLARAIRYAAGAQPGRPERGDLVDNPKGQVGRLSRSFTLEQSLALLEAARESRLNAYVVMSLATGIRTEEARELHWDHVDLDGDPGAARPVPPLVAVWRSVREGGDTKTAKSRRTLALPQAAVQVLWEHRKRQAEDRLAAGSLWQDHGLVFASAIGTPLDAANVRREFRQITEAAGLGLGWAPRDLRHTFVSLMSADGQQQPGNLKLARTLNPRATHGDALVMRSSLGDDEDQDDEVSTDVRDPGRRAHCVPDRAANAGNSRSLPDSPTLPAHLGTGRLTRCANRPSQQEVRVEREGLSSPGLAYARQTHRTATSSP